MTSQDGINYTRVANVISLIRKNIDAQPSLDEIAAKVNLSPFQFQRLFTDWADVSPKKFLNYISVQHVKSLLGNHQSTLFDVANKNGLSSTGRLHDLFVKIKGMTPGEYKNQGASLHLNYHYSETLFGELLIASSSKGVCYMGFSDDKQSAFSDLERRFPKAHFSEQIDTIQQTALQFFHGDSNNVNQIKLHIKGTDFQLKVWEALLKIPSGNLSTYGTIARSIQNKTASRAVGTAIGSNPIAYIIPCHRVIQSTGRIGGYMWGATRKSAIIGWEAAKSEKK